MDVFDNFLHEVCDQFDNMVITGDFNLPDIQTIASLFSSLVVVGNRLSRETMVSALVGPQ